MPEVKPTGRRDHTAKESGRNGDEAVTGAASEAFARWWHHRCASVELPAAGGIGLSCFCAIPSFLQLKIYMFIKLDGINTNIRKV